MKIILADDSSLLRDRIKKLIQEIKNVSLIGEAEDGIKALDLIKKLNPDLSIIDIRMPGLSGIDVLKKTRECGHHTKICILTNFPHKQYRERCFKEGADYFFDKSLEIQKMLDTITMLANREKYE